MKKTMKVLALFLAVCLLAGCAANAQPTASPASASFDELIPLATAFVDQLARGDFAAATTRFDTAMKNAMPEAKLKEVWTQLQTQAGAYQKQVGTRTAEQQNYRVVYVTCQFEKAALDTQVVFNAQAQISGLFFKPASTAAVTPQPTSAPTGAFREMEVTVGSGEWATPGTLSLPTGSGPFPAVVLVHGSGPNDRDETIGPNKPFRDLAWGLANLGVAVLRYDKRTLTHGRKIAASPALMESFTLQQETVEDALAAVKLLHQNPAIDPARVYVLGHSLGGTAAPRIAQQDASLAGIILLAGSPRPLEDLMVEQYTYIFSLNGGPSAEQKSQLETVKTQVARIKDANLDLKTPATDLMGANAAYWLDLRSTMPGEVAAGLTMPILVLQGERDYQVLAARDFTAWKTALAGKANATFKLYPTLNHLFISGEGPSTPQEYEKAGQVSAEVIKDIVNWINKK